MIYPKDDEVKSSAWYDIAVSLVEDRIDDDCVIENITSDSDGYHVNVYVQMMPVIKNISVVISV